MQEKYSVFLFTVELSVFPHAELWFKYWHSALEFSPRGSEDDVMVKTELQPPQGDHHFSFRNNRLVFNFNNISPFFFPELWS